MTDIVTRLRRWTISTDAVPASDLMDEAADEIERLRADLSRSGEIDHKMRASGEKCTEGESVSKNDQMRHVSQTCRQTNHDAVPAATARTDAATGEPGGGVGTGKQPAPPCVETDTPPSGSGGEPINRGAERQSPASDWREAQPLDEPRSDTKEKATGGRGHFLSEAEIDALEYVVVEGRIACHEDYGILRSLLVRLRPEWEKSGDLGLRPEDEIERLRGDAEIARLRLRAARAEADLLREAIRRLTDQDATLSVQGGNVTVAMDCTLTDEERAAIQRAIDSQQARAADMHSRSWTAAAIDDDCDTLRKLLERLT